MCLGELISVILIILKIMGYANCSWFMCLLPGIISFLLLLVIIIFDLWFAGIISFEIFKRK